MGDSSVNMPSITAPSGERQQECATPTLNGSHGLDTAKYADHADEEQQPTQDEGRIHDRRGAAKAKSADRLADRRIRRDHRAKQGVARTQKPEAEPGERKQERAGHRSQSEPARGLP